MNKLKQYQLNSRQNLPLLAKINKSKRVIREWYEKNNGNVYIAFSGGKDSTVMLHLVRSVYPNVKAVFVDTGLEYPEIKEFVKSISNVEIIRPKLTFLEVLEKYGFPIISKEVSKCISRWRNTKDSIMKEYYEFGTKKGVKIGKMGVIPKKWNFLKNAPFKISDRCCDIMKKQPFHKYEKKTGLKPFIGLMASESHRRKNTYLKYGCNAFDLKNPQSYPLGFWLEQDIWDYIRDFNLKYSSVYDTGVKRTGCVFCMFGLDQEEVGYTRFDKMKLSHPKLYDYCMNKLKIKKVINYIKNKGSSEVQTELRSS